jgi:hypothetical protein
MDRGVCERGSRLLDYSYSLLTCMNYDFRVCVIDNREIKRLAYILEIDILPCQ